MRAARYLIPFLVSSVLFGGLMLVLVRQGIHGNAGTLTYPLDDAYIHMAVGRNLALHGVWGITPHEFAGASSSPGWTLLLAALIRLTGVHLITPLIVNVAAGFALLLAASFMLAWALPTATIPFLAIAVSALVVVVPMPGLATIGMEHMLHSVAVVCLAAVGSWIVSRRLDQKIPVAAGAALVFGAMVCGALRYESCFVIAVTAALLLVRRRVGLAILMCFGAAVSPAVYGMYSYSHSGIPLPFSVVMKTSEQGLSPNALLSSSVSPIVLVLTVVFLLRLARRGALPEAEREPFWSFGQAFLAIALGTTIIQAELGPLGWLLRYESYLYAMGTVAFLLMLGEELAWHRAAGRPILAGGSRWAGAALLALLLPVAMDLFHRMHHGWSDVAISIHDRYVEHLPQALFVEETMPHGVVVAHDIGFLAYYADDLRILDPLGLGSLKPVQLKLRHGSLSLGFIDGWAKQEDAQLAIWHSDFPGMPQLKDWTLVEAWCFPSNLVFQNHVESFYAPDAKSAESLRESLAKFTEVPPEIVRYRYPADGTVPPEPQRGAVAECPVPASEAGVAKGQ